MNRAEYEIMHNIERSYWWFRGKKFLLEMLLRIHLENSNDGKLLDIGCGTGMILDLLNSYGTGYGVELSALAIKILRGKKQKLIAQSDANRTMPFKNNVFDTVTCLDVLEHIENDMDLIKEMVRICKPGGIIFITVPAMGFLWSYHDKALHHKRRYTKRPLVNKIIELDAELVKSSYFNVTSLFPLLIFRKLKSVLARNGYSKSDFFVPVPGWINELLFFYYISELNLLRIMNIPFGVSLLIALKKF